MATSKKTQRLQADNILASAATQSRKRIDPALVAQYVEDLHNGACFPPLIVFAEKNSERYILADGFHRLQAMVEAEVQDIEVEVHEGDLHAAFRYCLGSNAEHGGRRTNADKIHVVEMALKDPEVSQFQVQEIADICRVDRNTIRRVRERMLEEKKPGGKNKPAPAVDPSPDDVRPTKEPPTQEEVELEEVQLAMSAIKALPYGGEDIAKLNPSKDDVADFEYVSSWLAHAVLVMRK